MAYGIETLNENGIIQFSTQVTPLYTRVVSGSTTLSAASPSTGDITTSLVAPSIPSGIADSDLIWAYRPTSSVDGIYARPVGGKKLRIYNLDVGAVTVEYCAFADANKRTIPSSGYGLNVFDSSQDLLYSSEYPPASIETVLTLNLTSAANSVSYTFDSGAGLGRPWVLATAGHGAIFGNAYNWEPLEGGQNLGDAEYTLASIFWTSTTVGQGQGESFFEDGITISDFYNQVGVTYNTSKVVVLRGYAYN